MSRPAGAWTLQEAAAYITEQAPATGIWTVARVLGRVCFCHKQHDGDISAAAGEPESRKTVRHVTRASVIRYARLLNGQDA